MSDVDLHRGASVRRLVGAVGLVGTVLLFASVILGSPGEPELEASSAEAATFITGLDRWWVPVLGAIGNIAMIVLLWFMVGLALILRRHEGDFPWRSTMAMLSGALVAAYVVLDPAQEAAANRAAALDQAQLAFAYDLATIGFTQVWLAMGSFAFACGWLMVTTAALPRWLGWWGMGAGIAMALAQLVWRTEPAWLVPYAAFWLWSVTTCVTLVRRPQSGPARDSV